jgi:hypothetical protein
MSYYIYRYPQSKLSGVELNRFVAEEEDAAVPVYTCTVIDIVYILGGHSEQ